MSFARFLATLCGALLLSHCAHPVVLGDQSDVQQLYTPEPPAVVFPKVLEAVARERAIVVHSDAQAGTIQATAYRGKVTLLMLIQPVRGQTRVEAMARTEPGTFSHGKLDLAARVLARYQEGH
jgi:hypothetical protein